MTINWKGHYVVAEIIEVAREVPELARAYGEEITAESIARLYSLLHGHHGYELVQWITGTSMLVFKRMDNRRGDFSVEGLEL